jgi:hypothetical protein
VAEEDVTGGFTRGRVEHIFEVQQEQGVGKSKVCSNWARDVGFKHDAIQVDNGVNEATMNANSELAAREEVRGKVIGEVREGDHTGKTSETSANTKRAEVKGTSGQLL